MRLPDGHGLFTKAHPTLWRPIKNIGFDKLILVFDIIEMENDERDDLLKMDEGQMTDVAKFCNRYPNIEMNHEVVDPEEAQTGSPTIVNVTLEREDELQGNVIGKFRFW